MSYNYYSNVLTLLIPTFSGRPFCNQSVTAEIRRQTYCRPSSNTNTTDFRYSPLRLGFPQCWKTSTSRKLSRDEFKRAAGAADPSLRPREGLLGQWCPDHRGVRRLGRLGKRHDHRGTHAATGSARLQALSHHQPAHLRTAASLAVAVLAEGPESRRDGDSSITVGTAACWRSGLNGRFPRRSWRQAYRDIVEFERMLADDGTAILKFFLHISKKEQKEALCD